MPPREYHFYVYILSNRSRDLYIGVTNNLQTRLAQHRELRPGTHTARYEITRLVHSEYFHVNNAINREKELKAWPRTKKISLIEATNPTWEDLAKDW